MTLEDFKKTWGEYHKIKFLKDDRSGDKVRYAAALYNSETRNGNTKNTSTHRIGYIDGSPFGKIIFTHKFLALNPELNDIEVFRTKDKGLVVKKKKLNSKAQAPSANNSSPLLGGIFNEAASLELRQVQMGSWCFIARLMMQMPLGKALLKSLGESTELSLFLTLVHYCALEKEQSIEGLVSFHHTHWTAFNSKLDKPKLKKLMLKLSSSDFLSNYYQNKAKLIATEANKNNNNDDALQSYLALEVTNDEKDNPQLLLAVHPLTGELFGHTHFRDVQSGHDKQYRQEERHDTENGLDKLNKLLAGLNLKSTDELKPIVVEDCEHNGVRKLTKYCADEQSFILGVKGSYFKLNSLIEEHVPTLVVRGFDTEKISFEDYIFKGKKLNINWNYRSQDSQQKLTKELYIYLFFSDDAIPKLLREYDDICYDYNQTCIQNQGKDVKPNKAIKSLIKAGVAKFDEKSKRWTLSLDKLGTFVAGKATSAVICDQDLEISEAFCTYHKLSQVKDCLTRAQQANQDGKYYGLEDLEEESCKTFFFANLCALEIEQHTRYHLSKHNAKVSKARQFHLVDDSFLKTMELLDQCVATVKEDKVINTSNNLKLLAGNLFKAFKLDLPDE